VAYVASNGAKRVHALDTRLRGILRPQKWSCYTGGMTPQHSLASLSDAALLAHVGTLAERERHVTAEVIASLAELDARRLYLGAGCSSLFTYCTEVLYLSEHAAYGRIEAARAARRFPLFLNRRGPLHPDWLPPLRSHFAARAATFADSGATRRGSGHAHGRVSAGAAADERQP
jgi:hypothetical protein